MINNTIHKMLVKRNDIITSVKAALDEDLGSGDITAELISEKVISSATLITREHAILAGQAWFNEVFTQLDPTVQIAWLANDGDVISPNQTLCTLTGSARSLLSGERTAINFLQTLSGTASSVAYFVKLIEDTDACILDTRKTIPGLRLAQKYAVACGGGKNHRIGLYDQMLIKENHILAAGNLAEAIGIAKQKKIPVEVEVESIEELETVLPFGPDQVLLDNFNIADLNKAVSIAKGKTKLEVSGNVNEKTIRAIAKTGVDYISIGALTKHLKAIDFSMRMNT